MNRKIKNLMLGLTFFGTTGTLLAQGASSDESGGAIIGIIFGLIWIAVVVTVFVGMWKVFSKAGKPGWAIIIPIYNIIVILQIARKPIWWIILLFIPLVNIIISIIVAIEIAKGFGKGTGFGLGLAFLPIIFYPILGFGCAQYIDNE